MPKTKIAVTLEAALLEQVDELVRQQRYPNRSRAVEAAVAAGVTRLRRTGLAEACARLDPEEERALAEEGLGTGLAERSESYLRPTRTW